MRAKFAADVRPTCRAATTRIAGCRSSARRTRHRRCFQPVLVPQGFRGTLADDDAGSHGVAGRHARHDRAIRDAKVFDSIDLKLGVYDRHRIAAHLGSASLMVVSSGRIANEILYSGSTQVTSHDFPLSKRL